MEIQREQHGSAVVVAVSGTVDIHSSPTLRAELRQPLGLKVPSIVVDLAGVKFVDSSGLATLIEALKRANEYGGRLALCTLSKPVLGVFQLANLDRVFTIKDTREAALAG